MTKKRATSDCPIVYSLDIWGDPWSLMIMGSVLIHNKRYYREFLANREGITTSVLSARLRALTDAGLLTKIPGQTSRAQTMYRPTKKALDLLPVLFAVMRWGLKYGPNVDKDLPVMQEVVKDEAALKARLMGNFIDG